MEERKETYTKSYSIDVERANYHHKCKQRKIKRILIVLLLWIIVLVYFFTPISKVNLKVTGNVYYTKKTLMEMTYIKNNDYWWLVDTKKAKKVLLSYDFIDGVNISKSFLGIKIKINEVYPLAIKNNKYVMSNKQIIEKNNYDLNDKIDTLPSFDNIKNEDLDSLINEYRDINLKIRNHFNNIEIIKVEIDENKFYNYVKLYGYDKRLGHFVIKTDLVYLNTKFNENKYDKIIEEISKNNVKYDENAPALIAYHYLNEKEFKLVENFEEE